MPGTKMTKQAMLDELQDIGFALSGVGAIGNNTYRLQMEDNYLFYYYAYLGWPHTRDHIADYISKFPREPQANYDARVARAWPVNFTKVVTDKTINPIFSQPIERLGDGLKDDDGDEALFLKDANLHGMSLSRVLKKTARLAYTGGVSLLLIDRMPEDYNYESLSADADIKRRQALPYLAVYNATCIWDWGYDKYLNLKYVVLADNNRVMETAGKPKSQECKTFRIVTQQYIYVVTEICNARGEANNIYQHEVERFEHVLSKYNMLPVIPVTTMSDDEDQFVGPSGVAELSLMDRSVINYISLRDEVFYSQTFGILTIQADDTEHIKEVNTGTQSVLTYPSGMNMPMFISPDASLIPNLNSGIENTVAQIQRISDQRFSDVGSDTSGQSKEWDFHNQEFGILSFARLMEETENKVWYAWCLATGKIKPGEAPTVRVKYSDAFDLKGARQFIDDLTAMTVGTLMPPTAKKIGAKKSIIKLLNPTAEELEILEEELDEMVDREKLSAEGNMDNPDDPNNPFLVDDTEETMDGQTTNNNVGLKKKPDNRLKKTVSNGKKPPSDDGE